jgi:hypothetical protein
MLVTNKPSRHPGTKKSRTSYPKQALKAFRSQKVSYRLFQTRPQSAQEPKSLVLAVPNKPPRHPGTKKSRAACNKQAFKALRNEQISYFASQTSPQGTLAPKSILPFAPNEASRSPGPKSLVLVVPNKPPRHSGTKKSCAACHKQALTAPRNKKVSYFISQTSPQGTQAPKSLLLFVTSKPSRHPRTKKCRTVCPKQAFKASWLFHWANST